MSDDDWIRCRPKGCQCLTWFQRAQCYECCEPYSPINPSPEDRFLSTFLFWAAVLAGSAVAAIIYAMGDWW